MNYKNEPRTRLFEVFCLLPEKELTQTGVTVTFTSLVDLTLIEKIRSESLLNDRISYTAFVAKALALALSEYPFANRKIFFKPWRLFFRRRLVTFENCDIAIAAEKDFPGGESLAFVDVLKNADKLSLNEIKKWLYMLSNTNDNGSVQWQQFNHLIRVLPALLAALVVRIPSWFPNLWTKYRGGAALISSPGKYGADQIAAVWAWPLGVSFGRVKSRPVVKGGKLEMAPTFILTLNFDRRVMAGAPAGRFFKYFVQLLENPDFV